MPKLTLHIQDQLISAAKIEAAERKTSVSKLVSDFFRALAAEDSPNSLPKLPPITASLVGRLEDTSGQSDRENYRDHLESKHA